MKPAATLLAERVTRRAESRRIRELAAGYELPTGHKRIYLYHVRKAGGTSIERAFFELSGSPASEVHQETSGVLRRAMRGEMVFQLIRTEPIERGEFFFAASHSPAWSFTLPADTYTIAVFRDPVDRVVSLYNMLNDPRVGDYPFPPPGFEVAWARDGFDKFIGRMPVSYLLNQLHMFSATWDVTEAVERARAVDRMFPLRRLKDNLAELGAELDLPLAYRHDRKSSVTTTLTAVQRRFLERLLAPEYEMLDQLGCLSN